MADYVSKSTRFGALKFGLLVYTILFITLLYGPIIVMTILSFNGPNGGPTFPMNGFGLDWYHRLLNPSGVTQNTGEYMGNFGPPVLRSLALALATSAISTTLAVMAAMAFRARFRGSGIIFYIFLLGLTLPGVAIGLGHALFWQAIGIQRDWYTTTLLAHVLWTFPFCFIIMLTVMNRFDKSVEEAARCLGADASTTTLRITLPLIKPGVMASALFGFTLSFDEFARTSLVIGNSNTLPLEVLGATTVRVTPRIYAMGVLTTLISFGIIIVFTVLMTRKPKVRDYGVQEEY